MEPTLPDRSFAVFRATKNLRVGDIVLAKHPKYGTIIKAISKRAPDGFRLRGTSQSSVTEEEIGTVSANQIEGRLAFTIRAKSAGQL